MDIVRWLAERATNPSGRTQQRAQPSAYGILTTKNLWVPRNPQIPLAAHWEVLNGPLECSCTDSSQANIRSRPCPAISSCANNNFKYLRLQGPGSAHAEKDFLHIDVVNKYEQTHYHFELHICVNQLQKALDISKQFQSTYNSACHRLLPRCSCFHRVSPSKVAQTSSTGTSAPRNATATSQLCWWSTWQTRNFLHLVRMSDLHEVLVTSSDALKFEAFLRTSPRVTFSTSAMVARLKEFLQPRHEEFLSTSLTLKQFERLCDQFWGLDVGGLHKTHF